MLTWKRILCATDLGPLADAAIREADRRARLHGAELILLHALPTMYPGVPMSPNGLERALVERERLSADVIDAVLDRVNTLTGRGPEALSIIVDDGAPDESILTKARELAVDLIVLGSAGQGEGGRPSLFGSVARHVVRTAPCSVLIARSCPVTKRVLVATDFSEASNLALETAADESRRRGARLTVLHSLDVVSPGLAMGEPGALPAASLVAYPVQDMRLVAERHLDESLARLGVTAERLVVEEPARQAILHTAESTAADIVVMGGSGHAGLDRLLLGSVTEQIVREAPCSVLVVRQPEPRLATETHRGAELGG